MNTVDIHDRLLIINSMLEGLKVNILEEDIKSDNPNIIYLLTSIEVNAKRTKEIIKGK